MNELVLTYEALKADRDEQQKRADALAVENAAMREAIEFATAPDMWIEQHDGMLDYRYPEWYVDILNAAVETTANDTALAAIEARGVEKAIELLLNKFSGTGHIGVHVMALESLAAELREAQHG